MNEAAEPTNDEFTFTHSCGMWVLYRGLEIGAVTIPTRSMGKTVGRRYRIGERQDLKDIEDRLMKANAGQFNISPKRYGYKAGLEIVSDMKIA